MDIRTSPPTNVCANMSIFSLFLSINCLKSYGAIVVQDDSEQVAYQIMQLPRLLYLSAPKATYLRLAIYDWRQFSTRFSLGEWFNGETLDLSFIDCSFTSEIDIQIPSSVRKLSLYGSVHVAHAVSSNFVEGLSFVRQYFASFGRILWISISSIVNLDLWPSFESLQIEAEMVEWSKSSLAFLK
ncbi:hypothetical protein CPB86DRAFT_820550 [Serendipita vermifera]|nr:hypothetical protein CPB86DRAFT_820550 [Serendipita vermifera]